MKGVSLVTLEVNGQVVTGFKGITLPEQAMAEQEEIMDGVVQYEVGANHSPIEVEYIMPRDGVGFDWDSVEDGTLTVDFRNGVRWKYTGVRTLKKGSLKLDGKAATLPVSLGAEAVSTS